MSEKRMRLHKSGVAAPGYKPARVEFHTGPSEGRHLGPRSITGMRDTENAELKNKVVDIVATLMKNHSS